MGHGKGEELGIFCIVRMVIAMLSRRVLSSTLCSSTGIPPDVLALSIPVTFAACAFSFVVFRAFAYDPEWCVAMGMLHPACLQVLMRFLLFAGPTASRLRLRPRVRRVTSTRIKLRGSLSARIALDLLPAQCERCI